MLYYKKMAEGQKLEIPLYWLISLFINGMLFTLLAYYLTVRIEALEPSKPLEVFIQQEEVRVEEVKLKNLTKGGEKSLRRGEDLQRRGKKLLESAPYQSYIREGDKSLPSGRSSEEPSLLKEVEEKVKGKSKRVEEEGLKNPSEIGNITAVVSSRGLELSGGTRGTLYVPPMPKVVSDEPLAPLKIRVWIEPSGRVSSASIVQRSGSPEIDQKFLQFVKAIKFEPIKDNVLQTGIITFRFKGG